jgi:hypothetical protein
LGLTAGPFAPPSPGVVHRATCWQVRRADADWSTPAVSALSETALERWEIERGVLEPRKGYVWRAAHVGSNGRVSAYSEETAFATGAFPFTAVPLDLRAHFNRDVVAAPGEPRDAAGDTLDGLGRRLIVEGFDGARDDSPIAHGLPRDRRVGIHALGDYARPNVLQVAASQRRDMRIDAPPGRYTHIRFLVAGGSGDTAVPVSLVYASGPPGRGAFTCDDWYDVDPVDRLPELVSPGAVVAVAAMDRLHRGVFKDNNRPCLFEVAVRADPERTLRAVVLELSQARPADARAVVNVLAATAVRAE